METNDAKSVSLAVYLDRHTTRHPIYVALIVVTFASMMVLPFIKTEVSVSSPGVLRPVSTITRINSYSSGIVVENRTRENRRVTKGELLLRVHSLALDQEQTDERARLNEVLALTRDVQALLARVKKAAGPNWTGWTPTTPLYKQWLIDFRQRYGDVVARALKAKHDHARSYVLFQNDVIAASEMELADEALRTNEEAVAHLVQTQLTEWEQVALKYRDEIAHLNRSMLEAKQEEAQNQVVAPVSGTLHQMAGLYPGSAVFSGQELGYISPDTTLIAEVHVAPADIGLIVEGMVVRCQIMAYDYGEWGLLDAVATEVSGDVVAADESAHYLVSCELSREFLQLPNGYRGTLRKGMTLRARFIVARRSLWQLLYDAADDWMNPNR